MTLLEHLRATYAPESALQRAEADYKIEQAGYRRTMRRIRLAGLVLVPGGLYPIYLLIERPSEGLKVLAGLGGLALCVWVLAQLGLTCPGPYRLEELRRLHRHYLPGLAERLLKRPQALLTKSDLYYLVPADTLYRLEHVVHSDDPAPLYVSSDMVTHLVRLARRPQDDLDAEACEALQRTFGSATAADGQTPVTPVPTNF